MADEQTPAVLTAEDYQALHAMQMSDDPSQRAQAASLAKKLTSDEQRAFFDVQQTANKDAGERTREDNSLFGMPPEVAVLSGIGLGRAIGAAGLTAAGRAVAGLKSAGAQVTPIIKYEATKTALEAVGVPKPLATAAAYAVSSYRRGASSVAEAETVGASHLDRSVPVQPGSLTQKQLSERILQGHGTPAPPREQLPPIAPRSVVSAAVSPPTTATGNPSLPDQKALNEAALAARRAAYQASRAPAADAAVPATFKPGVTPIKLSAAEVAQGMKWAKEGVPADEIMQRIEASRAFAAQMNLSTPTVAATKFPKGMRGGAGSQSVTPNAPPSAAAAAQREAPSVTAENLVPSTVLPAGTQSRLRALGVSEDRIESLTIPEANMLLKAPKALKTSEGTLSDARIDELLRRNFGGKQ